MGSSIFSQIQKSPNYPGGGGGGQENYGLFGAFFYSDASLKEAKGCFLLQNLEMWIRSHVCYGLFVYNYSVHAEGNEKMEKSLKPLIL